MEWYYENMLIVSEFNMLGLWPLILLAQCRPYLSYKPQPYTPPLGLLLCTGMCLGCAVKLTSSSGFALLARF